MSDKPVNENRRDAVKRMLGAALAIPVINLVGVGSANAQAAVPADAVAANDPTAVALKYSEDATKADRANAVGPGKPREGLPAAEQKCSNCQLLVPGADTPDWQGCTLFPGKLVSVNGWCVSWTVKPA
ncbi:high-potential iron-sulfur protein [uncultured Thiodictyon sp.]|uniref:high-potential iron-sulfur protein n=1 Tax=uncultured Thiodictyon sp. TaxID=1846217 RepID=UPI0025ECA826|nr:high-potential iron-sulfur protein [uncultured Thiodictyon sp.]